MRILWPTIYRKIKFDGVLFVIDALDTERFSEAKAEFERLINEEELRNCVFCILYNYKKSLEEPEEFLESAKILEDLSPEKKGKGTSKEEENLIALKKALDFQLELDNMHTYQVRKSFILDVLDNSEEHKVKFGFESVILLETKGRNVQMVYG